MAKTKKEEKPSVEIIQHKEEPKELVKSKNEIGLNNKGIVLKTYDDLVNFSEMVFKNEFAPKAFKTPQAVLIAMQAGMELGLSPLASLQNIAVINNMPTIYGDGAKALVLASGTVDYIREYYEGTPYEDNFTAVCVSKRKGQQESIEKFSVADARLAGLWGKEGTWKKYPKRMLKFRARGFSLRDTWTDVMKGFSTTEEVADYEVISSNTSVSNTTIKKSGATKMRETMGVMPPTDDETPYEEVK